MKGPLDTHWKIKDKDGWILDYNGERSAVVHQWDRFHSGGGATSTGSRRTKHAGRWRRPAVCVVLPFLRAARSSMQFPVACGREVCRYRPRFSRRLL